MYILASRIRLHGSYYNRYIQNIGFSYCSILHNRTFSTFLLSQNYAQTLCLSALLSLRYKGGTNHLIFSLIEGDFDVVTRRERSGICYHPKPVLNYHQRTYFTYAKLHFCLKTVVYKQFIFLNKLNSYFGVCLTFSLY